MYEGTDWELGEYVKNVMRASWELHGNTIGPQKPSCQKPSLPSHFLHFVKTNFTPELANLCITNGAFTLDVKSV
jgi:hypothetical protein